MPPREGPGVTVAESDLSEELAVVGYGGKVDWTIDLSGDSLLAGGPGERDGMTFGIAIGTIRSILLVRQKRVEGVSRVDMQISKKRQSLVTKLATGDGVLASACAR